MRFPRCLLEVLSLSRVDKRAASVGPGRRKKHEGERDLEGYAYALDFYLCGDQTWYTNDFSDATSISEIPYHTPHNKYSILRDRIHLQIIFACNLFSLGETNRSRNWGTMLECQCHENGSAS